MPMKNPPHPGDLIKTEIVDALGLSVSRAAEILGVRRATLSDLLHGKASLSARKWPCASKRRSARTWTTFSECS